MAIEKNWLLNVRDNKPWKVKTGEVYYRDLVILHIDFENCAAAQIIVNKKLSGVISIQKALSILNEIPEVRKEKGCKNVYKTVIWCNDLTIAQGYFKGFEKMEYSGIKGTEVWKVFNSDFEIRNFNLISNSNDLEELSKCCGFEKDLCGGVIMKKFLELRQKQGLVGWGKLNYSFAYCANKLFSKELRDINYSNSNSIPSLDVYRMIQNCNKSGVITYNKNIEGEVLKNVYGLDISSAYPSKLVNTMLPQGQFGLIVGTPKEVLRQYKAAKDNDWSYLVKIKVKKEIEELDCILNMEVKKEGEELYYYLNDWDIKCIEMLGIKLNGAIAELRICKEKDYLEKKFRERIVEYYNSKQESKGVNEELYFERKTSLDAIWGKGLQEFNPTSDEKVKARYFRNYTHYLLPQWSLWSAAATRFEIIKALVEICNSNMDDFVAGDTDGIKFRGEEHLEYFRKRNAEIMEMNAAAGFPECEIGTWKFEGCFENFIQLRKKVYAYSINGELTCKFAGCRKKAWKEYFGGKSVEECFKELSNPDFFIPALYKNRKVFCWNGDTLLLKYDGFILEGESIETDKAEAV